MGLFDFLKKKAKSIEENQFLSTQFQNEICALALWKLKENNFNPNSAITELKKVGLNGGQIDYIIEKTKKLVTPTDNYGLQNTEFGISDDLLNQIEKKEVIAVFLPALGAASMY